MIRKLYKHELDFDKTLSYFKEQLDIQNILSRTLLKEMNFQNGSFFTLLTAESNLNRLYDFELGGMLPSYPTENFYIDSLDEEYQGEKINSINNELSTYLLDFLNNHLGWMCLFEDVTSEPDDPHFDLLISYIKQYKNEVYYCINGGKAEKKILSEAIDKTVSFWHFLCVIAKCSCFPEKKMSINYIEKVCANIKIIIIGAYDGEGYVFWEKSLP